VPLSPLVPVTSTPFVAACIAVTMAKDTLNPSPNAFSALNSPAIQVGDISRPQVSSHTLPSPLSQMETTYYYAGLPSAPVLVARTSTISWNAPTGPEAYRRIKELCAVGNHVLVDVWEDNLALKIHAVLEEMRVMWTSTDVVRIGYTEEAYAPVILWIGVIPESLSGNDGLIVASKCKKVLEDHSVVDVHVEIRESTVTRGAGPGLLMPTFSSNPTVDIREPLTTMLGLPISTRSTPHAEGTGGFFISDGGNTKKLFLVTARHVVLEPDGSKNELFVHKNMSQRRHDVTLFGDAGFTKYLESIQVEIGGQGITAQHQEGRLRAINGRDGPAVDRERKEAQNTLDKAMEAKKELWDFYGDVSTGWATQESRTIGHVIIAPPINVGVGSDCYTEDWAVIEIDASKVDANNFNGNAIDLGTRIGPDELTRMMHPDIRNPSSFKYPHDRLLRLKGTIPVQEIRKPSSRDQDGDPCLMVLKRGNATGLTIGRANNIFSYVRNYYDDGNAETSKEWAILPFDSNSGAFSARGDSGSVIVDGLGRIGGLLTGGAGSTPSSDVTYATPIQFLLKCIKGNGLEPNVNPVLTA